MGIALKVVRTLLLISLAAELCCAPAVAAIHFRTRTCEWFATNQDLWTKWMRDQSKWGDVDEEIRQVLTCIQSGKLDFDATVLATWQHNGYEAEAKFYSNLALRASSYRPVSDELKHYVEYAEKSGIKFDPATIEQLRAAGEKQTNPAATCPLQDLRSQFGPVRDQDHVGNCFANATADYFSRNGAPLISAWDLYLSYQKMFLKEKISHTLQSDVKDGGAPSDVYLAAFKYGACLEKDFPSEYAGNSKVTDDNDGDDGLNEMLLSLEREAVNNKIGYIPFAFSTNCSDQNRLAALGDALGIQDILKLASKSNDRNVAFNLDAAACSKKKRITLPKVKPIWTMDVVNHQDYLDLLDAQLDRKTPVIISFKSDVLFSPERAQTGDHVSLVVGKRFNSNTGRCEYLIRNSWGKGCDGYSASYTCEDGNIWVPREVLEPSIYAAGYFK